MDCWVRIGFVSRRGSGFGLFGFRAILGSFGETWVCAGMVAEWGPTLAPAGRVEESAGQEVVAVPGAGCREFGGAGFAGAGHGLGMRTSFSLPAIAWRPVGAKSRER